MIVLAAVAAPLVALWIFSRVVVLLIERRWPPLGEAVEANGLRLNVLDVPGSPDGATLLLIHGASGNLREPFFGLRGQLSGRSYRIIAVDRPGHGHSSRDGRSMSDPAGQADAIAAALASLRGTPCLVLGHSWGAAVAALLAVRHPERVSGLVLVAPATHPWPGGVSARSRFFANSLLGRIAAEFLVVPLGLAMIRPSVRSIFAPAPVPDGYARRIGAALAIRPASFVATCRDIADFYGHVVRHSPRYSEIRCPVEIVTGDWDRVVSPVIHAFGLARDIPGARLTVLPGAGHMPHWSRPAEVAAAIRRVAERARILDETQVGSIAEAVCVRSRSGRPAR